MVTLTSETLLYMSTTQRATSLSLWRTRACSTLLSLHASIFINLAFFPHHALSTKHRFPFTLAEEPDSLALLPPSLPVAAWDTMRGLKALLPPVMTPTMALLPVFFPGTKYTGVVGCPSMMWPTSGREGE